MYRVGFCAAASHLVAHSFRRTSSKFVQPNRLQLRSQLFRYSFRVSEAQRAPDGFVRQHLEYLTCIQIFIYLFFFTTHLQLDTTLSQKTCLLQTDFCFQGDQ